MMRPRRVRAWVYLAIAAGAFLSVPLVLSVAGGAFGAPPPKHDLQARARSGLHRLATITLPETTVHIYLDRPTDAPVCTNGHAGEPGWQVAYQFDTRLSTIAFLTQMDKAMTTFGWLNAHERLTLTGQPNPLPTWGREYGKILAPGYALHARMLRAMDSANGTHHWKMGTDAYASSSPANGC